MLIKLKYSERKSMREALSNHAKLAFVGFCTERCIGEARRHASPELARAAKLVPALDWLWRSVEDEPVNYQRDLTELHKTLDSFEPPVDDESLAVGKHDITVSKAMLCVDEGFSAIRDPKHALLAVTRSFEAVCSIVERIYQDGRSMAEKEAAVLDEALRLLHALGGQSIRREMFANIPDYERGPVSPRYLGNRRLQVDDEEEDEA